MITFKQVETMIHNAHQYKDIAEAEGSTNYYYWDGYINALEVVQSNLLKDDLDNFSWFAIR